MSVRTFVVLPIPTASATALERLAIAESAVKMWLAVAFATSRGGDSVASHARPISGRGVIAMQTLSAVGSAPGAKLPQAAVARKVKLTI